MGAMGRRHRTEAQAARAERKRITVAAVDRFETAAAELEIDGQHVSPPLVVACPECGAQRGRRCQNQLGTQRKEPHGPRLEALERERDDADVLYEAHWQWCRQRGLGLTVTMR